MRILELFETTTAKPGGATPRKAEVRNDIR